MLLREITVGALTVLVEENEGIFEIKALENAERRVFMHIYPNYEVVKHAMDRVTALIENHGIKEEDVIQILNESKEE